MIKFSRERVLLLHQIIGEATGGSIGVRDEGFWILPWKVSTRDLAVKSFIRPKRKRAPAWVFL